MDFNGYYTNRPEPEVEALSDDYLVEDLGLLADNKTRIEQMMLAGQRLNDASRLGYTYDEFNEAEASDLALPYGMDKLDMSDRLLAWQRSLVKRAREESEARQAAERIHAQARPEPVPSAPVQAQPAVQQSPEATAGK